MTTAVGQFHLRMLERLSALIDPDTNPPVQMFVTSTLFAAIYAEMKALVTGPVQPNPQNFKELMVGKNMLVINSGSEDQAAVNIANVMEAQRANFAWRRDNLRTG